MKKVIALLSLVTLSFSAFSRDGSQFSGEFMRASIVVLVIFMFMMFIYSILKLILEHRIKNKITEKGVPESLATSLLYSKKEDSIHAYFKYFLLLAGTGIGLVIVYYTLPLDIHSLAIMAISISISFLCYYIFIRLQQNSPVSGKE